MTVRRLPPLVLALALGLLAAFAVACGDEGDERKLLSPASAEAIREELDTVAERVERGECDKLDPAFIRLDRAVTELPRATDRRLKRRLEDGVDNLRSVARSDCRDNRPETTETTETTPETTETLPPETTETVPPATTETVPPATTETTPPPTTTVPPEEPVPPVDEGDSGGAEAPGFVPPGQARKDKG